jgi:hypothetical protein
MELVHFGFDTWLGIAGIIIAVVALAMATPPFLQMMFGDPRIRVTFEGGAGHRTEGGLFCLIQNEPIDNLFLRSCGVERQGTNIVGHFSIYKYGTPELVGDITHAVFLPNLPELSHPSLECRLDVRAPAVFIVVAYDVTHERVRIVRRPNDSDIFLDHGRYRAEFDFTLVSRNRKIRISKNFVSGRVNEIKWIGD